VREAIVLFTRDLRVHDHPALAEAARRSERVTPLFVLDDGILQTEFARPNRVAFLLDALADLDRSLRGLGSALVVRRGDVVAETVRVARGVGASAVFASEDVSSYAGRRRQRLADALAAERTELRLLPGVTVVPPDELAPSGGDHYRVFGAYHRAWSAAPRRAMEKPPLLSGGEDVEPVVLPRVHELVEGESSPDLPAGGETAGRGRLDRWVADGLARYAEDGDDLGADATSRLSPYLHFGCVSPLTVADRAAGSERFVRQLCWRDFCHQLLAANPGLPREDLRSRGDRWRRDEEALQAWKEGCTGIPIVDAGIRQLAREGWMHNRARLLAASFLVKDLHLDWRAGERHFFDLLVDGDLANNAGNWQWVAGTGTDTRPNRVFNPLRQARRFDPDGDYVRRHVPELGAIMGSAVHEPWKLEIGAVPNYPLPLVDHDVAARRFRARRAAVGRR
jgi:deoxyribodipyrimidine photo-lyase